MALSKRSKLNDTYLRDILDKGQTPTLKSAEKLSVGLSIDLRDWYVEDGNETVPAPAVRDHVIEFDGTEFARLPVYDIRFAAGPGSQNYEEIPIDYYVMSIPLLREMTPAPLSEIGVFQVDGDSMEPTLHHRDWIMVDRRRVNLVNPGIYALNLDGESVIKRAAQHIETRTVTLTSDNAKYKPQVLKHPERLIVIGRMFLSIRRH